MIKPPMMLISTIHSSGPPVLWRVSVTCSPRARPFWQHTRTGQSLFPCVLRIKRFFRFVLKLMISRYTLLTELPTKSRHTRLRKNLLTNSLRPTRRSLYLKAGGMNSRTSLMVSEKSLLARSSSLLNLIYHPLSVWQKPSPLLHPLRKHLQKARPQPNFDFDGNFPLHLPIDIQMLLFDFWSQYRILRSQKTP